MTNFEIAAELRHVIKHMQGELKIIEARTDRPPAPDPISDHAIVRYMERVKGIDMRRLRTEILPHKRRGLLKVGLGRIKCEGHELVCNSGVVVTII